MFGGASELSQRQKLSFTVLDADVSYFAVVK
jgi:hypothetical protein